jgi:glycosyltransferase involved in cell wall biosynthesis
MPVFNHAEYISEALHSALGQTHPPLEVFVVDDGSTDASAEIAARFGPPVTLLRQPHQGVSAARNHAIAHVRGTHVAFLDADDIWEPDKLERQLAAWDESGGDALLFGLVTEFVSPEIDAAAAARIRTPLQSVRGIGVSALMAPAATLRRVGPFAENLVVGEWADWYVRAEELGVESIVVPAVVVRRRLHLSNHGLRAAAHRSEYLQVVKAALDRRRAEAEGHDRGPRQPPEP